MKKQALFLGSLLMTGGLMGTPGASELDDESAIVNAQELDHTMVVRENIETGEIEFLRVDNSVPRSEQDLEAFVRERSEEFRPVPEEKLVDELDADDGVHSGWGFSFRHHHKRRPFYRHNGRHYSRRHSFYNNRRHHRRPFYSQRGRHYRRPFYHYNNRRSYPRYQWRFKVYWYYGWY